MNGRSKKCWSSLYILCCIICTIISTNHLHAQSNKEGIFFQALARDNYFNIAIDQDVHIKSSILNKTGALLLKEEHWTKSNREGIFSILIGKGTKMEGLVDSIQTIPWADGPYYLQLSIAFKPTNAAPNWNEAASWTDLGLAPFGVVPIALYAKTFDSTSIINRINTKLTITDTASMLASYVKITNLNSLVTNKVNIADSTTVYVTPSQLNAKTFDSTAIYNQLNLKETATNKSTNIITDGNSDSKFPSVKSVKSYVDAQVAGATIVDAAATTKGKIQLAGDLGGTAAAPIIVTDAITTNKIKDANVTDAKIATISGSKIIGNINGNAATASVATTATKLAATKNINGVAFDGTTDIIIAAASNTLTGTTLATNITHSSLTGVATLTSGAIPYSLLIGTVPTWNQNTTGNAATSNAAITATKFAATKNINGIAFDGSADITIAADANTLTGTTLASNITVSSLTTVGTISTGVWSGTAIANNKLANSALTIGSTNIALGNTTTSLAGLNAVTATNFIGDLTGNVTGNVSGNAATTTKLAATKSINGVAFDGSTDITIAADANTLTGTSLASNVLNAGLTTLSNLHTVGTISQGTWSATSIDVTHGGTGATSVSGLVKGNGTNAFSAAVAGTDYSLVREITDEFLASVGQTIFTLSQTKSTNSVAKMFVNGIRISNTAYSITGTSLTYIPANNGSNTLSANDRIQIDYYY